VSNFREGLSAHEYFSSCHGARKGTADTSLKTASAGYLTRKLVMAATDVVVEQEDCGTKDGRILIFNRREDETLASYAQRLSLWLLGRILAAPLVLPADSNGCIFSTGQEIDENAITRLAQEISFQVSIRSVLTCNHPAGVCARCYGRDLAKGKLVIAGQRLTDGDIDPHDYLAAVGSLKFQEWLVDQVQKIYEIQGVAINPKHLEIIARLMVARPQTGGQGCRSGFSLDENQPELRGIAEVALSANSFLAGAAFQFTAKILAEAAVMGRQDNFKGVRENVMIGKLIPAGAGFVSLA